MAAKQIVFSEDARRKLKNGMNVVANAVGATLGPKGRNVAIDRKFGSPTVTHDGVSVAKEIELEDPFENMGAQLLKEAAQKTNDIAGDGTTTSTVLAHAIVNEGLKALEAGYNPMLLKHGISTRHRNHRGRTPQDVRQDRHQAKTLLPSRPTPPQTKRSAVDRRRDGQSRQRRRHHRGRIQDHAVRAGIRRRYAVRPRLPLPLLHHQRGQDGSQISDAYVLINEKKISAAQDIVPLLEKLVQIGKRELVIIAEDIDGEALATSC
jgi:chaperonin GroEL